MRFNVTALALTSGLIWSGLILFIAVANLIRPSYGRAFLDLAASIYPGYRPGTGMGSVTTGTLYGLVDGAIGGVVFGWLHDLLANQRHRSPT